MATCSDTELDKPKPDKRTQDVVDSSDVDNTPDGEDAPDGEDTPDGEDAPDVVEDTKDEDDSTDDDTEQPSGDLVELKVLAFNDLHGRLEAPAGRVNNEGNTLDAGGMAYLKVWAQELSQDAEHSILVSAGDTIGATPLMSAMFRDEPTIVALNMLGLEVTAVGNHEFDAGWEELLRLQNGGCHADGCDWMDPFPGADYPYLGANVITETGDTLLPSTLVKEYGGVKVGFIGLTLEETGQITLPSATAGLTFDDEVDTIDREVALLQAQGIEAIVVLIHEGGQPTSAQNSVNDCGDVQGPIANIARQSSAAVDVFISGHTHQTYICDIDGRLVTSAFSYGRVITEIDLMLDPVTGDITQKTGLNHVVRNDTVTPDSELSDFVSDLADTVAAADPVIAQINQSINRTVNDHGESPIGVLVADSHLYATRAPGDGGAQIAFANAGGLRANLTSSGATPENPGDITYSDAFAVLSFNNDLVTLTLTGAQIHTLPEQQFSSRP